MWYIALHQAAPDVLHKASNQWSRINVVFDSSHTVEHRTNATNIWELFRIRCGPYPSEMDNQRWIMNRTWIELFAIHFKVTMVPGWDRWTWQRSHRGSLASCHQSCSSNRRCQLWSRSRARSSCDSAQCGFLATMLEKNLCFLSYGSGHKCRSKTDETIIKLVYMPTTSHLVFFSQHPQHLLFSPSHRALPEPASAMFPGNLAKASFLASSLSVSQRIWKVKGAVQMM